MTAAQNTVALKRSSFLGGLLAAALVALIVAIVAIAISARPLAAPATATVARHHVQALHHRQLSLAPTITGNDQANAYIQWLLDRHYQAMAAAEATTTNVQPLLNGSHGSIITSGEGSQIYLQRLVLHGTNLHTLPPKPSYPDVTAPKHPRMGGPRRG